MSIEEKTFGHILGLEYDEVRLSQFRKEWSVCYHEEIMEITSALPTDFIINAEHIGSTAVPEIAAKPIIDIMIGVSSPLDFSPVHQVLIARGYNCEGEKNGISNCEFYTFGSPCIFHVHLTVVDSDFWKRQIRFREYIKQHNSRANDYVRLKTELADLYPKNRSAYTQGKTEFIEETLAKAFSRDN